ncbi:hypothetical protein TFLX_00532 [Thermoflexales bacterium]|nr:hypothetical protein TFLX_00532 [Thermoflexales bacterium]
MGMLKYVESLLGKNEQILWRARQHWIVLTANFVINLFLFIAIWVLYALLGAVAVGGVLLTIRPFVLLALLIPIGWFGWELLQWWAEEYLITTTRVVQTEGLINKHTKDSALEKINDITLNQSVLGRLLNYGDLAIITGSDLGTNLLKRLAQPVEFKKTLLEQKNKLSDGDDLSPRQAAMLESNAEDPLKKIAQLDDLRKSGAISEVEYQQAKAKLLAKL